MVRKKVEITPQQVAETAAENYVGALSRQIPFDQAGNVNLIDEYNDVRAALIRANVHGDEDKHEEAYAMHAGYLLGVAIGRRLGSTSVKGGA